MYAIYCNVSKIQTKFVDLLLDLDPLHNSKGFFWLMLCLATKLYSTRFGRFYAILLKSRQTNKQTNKTTLKT